LVDDMCVEFSTVDGERERFVKELRVIG